MRHLFLILAAGAVVGCAKAPEPVAAEQPSQAGAVANLQLAVVDTVSADMEGTVLDLSVTPASFQGDGPGILQSDGPGIQVITSDIKAEIEALGSATPKGD